ncbi:MAG: tubulin-like doman-containing protein [Pirellulaceae bacterium]
MDFIATDHNLQHLDVKPENLLLVGKHAKLADFGLVKSLQENSQSLMGGLTPAYAAPELFDGRPSLQSDQYSLAILFQEMLTGERCFDGSTPAQLAAQHMHGQPNLNSLPKSDQAVVGRALSKTPSLRYKSCRAFIEELVQRKSIMRERKRTQIPTRVQSKTDTTDVQIRFASNAQDVTQNLSLSEIHGKAKAVTLAPPPTPSDISADLIPTLFIGIGKTGTAVCQKLKKRIVANHGEFKNTPAFKILCLDSDRNELANASGGLRDDSLNYGETCSLPLRRAEDYRDRSHVHSGWLNRRWIYNIPKSQQTEGLRPLGRLAFVDNFQELYSTIDKTIESMVSPEAIAMTTEEMNQSFASNRFRVYIITSIAGGAGSGMTLDVAYTIKQALREQGLPTTDVHGILIHACNSRERESGIAVANSFAFLTELRHMTESGYPGESACGIPAMEEELPIDFPYFLNLGMNMKAEDWRNRLDAIGEYLFLNTMHGSSTFFEDCRELENENEHFSLRSLGVSNEGLRDGHFQNVVDLLHRELLDRWTGISKFVEPLEDPFAANPEWACPDKLENNIIDTLNQFIDKAALDSARTEVLNALLSRGNKDAALFAPLRQLYGKKSESTNTLESSEAPFYSVQSVEIFNAMESLRAKWTAQVDSLLSGQFHRRRFSCKNVQQLITLIESDLKEKRELAKQVIHVRQSEANAFEREVLGALRGEKDLSKFLPQVESFLEKYCEILRSITIHEVLFQIFRQLQLHLNPFREKAHRLKMTLSGQCNTLRNPADLEYEIQMLEGFDRAIVDQILKNREQIVDQAENRFFIQHVEADGSFEELLLTEGLNLNKLFSDALTSVRAEVVVAGKQLNLDQVLFDMIEVSPEAVGDRLHQMVNNALPWTDQCGGTARMLVALPEQAPSKNICESINRLAGTECAVSMTTSGEMVILTECEKIELADVAFRLLQQRSDCADLAARVASRNDIRWKSLTELV